MTPPSYLFIDANLIMYTIGGPHPLQSPCKAVLEKIKLGNVLAVTNTEVLQEILYRYFSIKRQTLGQLAYTSLVDLCAEVLPVTRQDTDTALTLLKKYAGIMSRDAVHAATMINNGIQEICSTDPHFDLIPEIRRILPG
ncbi:MAG: type II toxin-antitoxin system VapC family toxin [Deltaproteobacteria bacterium]|nr:type II toxin-antitoxin system VapC family toxin [Deltaproteobacteria bacterium]